jgi:hypothetical protein
MKLLHRLTIRQKIISIILTVTIISIITGFTIEIFSNIKASKNELKNNTTLDAKLIADYLIPTFLFNDQSGAKEILLKLANIPTIIMGPMEFFMQNINLLVRLIHLNLFRKYYSQLKTKRSCALQNSSSRKKKHWVL